MSGLIDEDELLNDSDFQHHDVMKVLDEEILLGVNSTGVTLISEENGDIKVGESIPKAGVDESFEKEELDYDEDEDEEKQERTSRFTSERRPEKKTEVEIKTVPGTVITSIGTTRVGNNWSGGSSNNFNRRPNDGPRPLTNTFVPPPFPVYSNGPHSKVLVNPNFCPAPQPMVSLRMDGAPPQVFGAPFAQNPMMAASSMGPIVPRLPSGIPLISGLPSNHGMAGFGPSVHERMQGGGGISQIGYGMSSGGNWDRAVEDFLMQASTSSGRTRRRSSSYSGDSSYSESYSSGSRSRSRSPRRRRPQPSEKSRAAPRRRDDGDRRRPREQRRENPRRDDAKRRQNNEQISMECAKAIGLSKDYLMKVDEQKKKRDEILRRKEQRRYGADEQPQNSTGSSKQTTQPQQQQSATSTRESRSETAKIERERKTKAYLAVNVNNVKQLPTAKLRVETLAKELGAIRKCWQSSDDTVSVIFLEHDKAKDFMLKYNNKVLSGLRVSVALEKKYLNLSEMS
ncbi:unnamed protein product [Caenorhabditis auriculariae]|uniref:Uncharacterized protein n=1 Tax=Caenorhabditis auriculariae TaxID=2777116 RepID=A0A8S1GZN7_9PELO|nr:unnamed protein product [Caenorhabditis auriculariae]